MKPEAVLRAVVAPVLLAVALGAAGGWLWWTWWGPAPKGQIYDTTAGPTWYPNPFDPGITRDFSGTAEYVVIGFGLALLVGVVGGLLARNEALLGLGAALVGSIAGAALMTAIGLWQSPSDPQDQAAKVKIDTVLPGNLEVTGWTPYLAWPVGCLLGYLVVMLALNQASARVGSSRPEQPSAAPAPQG